MSISKPLDQGFLKYIDFPYFIKLTLLIISLYYFHQFYIDKTDLSNNSYSPFLVRYLNYPAWIVTSVLHTANIIAHAIGLDSYITSLPENGLRVKGGHAVYMIPACIGLQIMSFWFAFIIASRNTWKQKLIWCISGLLTIWFINCFRVAVLLLAVNNKVKVNRIDHHQVYNLCAYAVILIMLYLYYLHTKSNKYKIAV